jgi:hypothetical protein
MLKYSKRSTKISSAEPELQGDTSFWWSQSRNDVKPTVTFHDLCVHCVTFWLSLQLVLKSHLNCSRSRTHIKIMRLRSIRNPDMMLYRFLARSGFPISRIRNRIRLFRDRIRPCPVKIDFLFKLYRNRAHMKMMRLRSIRNPDLMGYIIFADPVFP